ncbi:MAG: FxsA family protein [Actinobacteria bacterium]|nr:FxsA family protein [Actinomycetota bacterium]
MTVLLALFALGVVEIWTAVLVAQWIGAFATAMVLVGLSLLGVLLVRSEGLAVWRRVDVELSSGRMPTESLLDGLLVLVGGMLLIVPGFVTAVPGLALLAPPTRKLARPVLQRWVERRAARAAQLGGFTFTTSTFGGATFSDVPGGAHIRGPVIDVEGRDADVGSAGADRGRGGVHAEIVDIEVDRPEELGPPR